MSSSASTTSEDNKTPNTNPKNRPPNSAYLKAHKNVSFSYAPDATTFQQGQLGDSDTYLVGTLHLNYSQPRQLRSVVLHLKGTEKTSWYKAQARSKALYMGEQILVDNTFKIWETEDHRDVQNLDIPFKVKLPYNLPESVSTDIGSVNYVLRATVNRKGNMVMATNQVVEVLCPLKKTLMMDNQNNPPYKLRGESRSGLDYTFVLPPNKNLNLGSYVSIPMRIRFLRPGISVERVEILLKTCMDFRCNNPNETRHVKEHAAALVVPRQEIRYVQPDPHSHEGECLHTINLFIPRSVQPTYSGRFISITHQLCIKFCLWGADMDFQVEEGVRVANILEKHAPNDVLQQGGASSVSSSPRLAPTDLSSVHKRQLMPPSRPESPYSYQSIYEQNLEIPPGFDPRDIKLRAINPRFLGQYNAIDDNPASFPPRTASPRPMHPSQLQAHQIQQQAQLNHLQARNRRPSQSSTVDSQTQFPYDGYAAQNPLNHQLSIESQKQNPYNLTYNGLQYLWYRHKLDVAFAQHLRPAEPKLPPVHPPPPVPPIGSIYSASGLPSPASPNTKNSILSGYHAYQTPLPPPPYRQPASQTRPYIDTAYAYDFDD